MTKINKKIDGLGYVPFHVDTCSFLMVSKTVDRGSFYFPYYLFSKKNKGLEKELSFENLEIGRRLSSNEIQIFENKIDKRFELLGEDGTKHNIQYRGVNLYGDVWRIGDKKLSNGEIINEISFSDVLKYARKEDHDLVNFYKDNLLEGNDDYGEYANFVSSSFK